MIRAVAFDALSPGSLYGVLKLRFDVFVLEQQSLYPELDGADPHALHLVAGAAEAPEGVARILGLDGDGPVAIGRVAIAKSARGHGLGRRLVAAALAEIAARAPGRPVTLGAQLHLERFYGGFGFHRCSEVYDDGGIDHVDMILHPAAANPAAANPDASTPSPAEPKVAP